MTNKATLFLLVFLMSLSVVLAPGCKPNPERQAAAEARLNMLVEKKLSEIMDLQMQGKADVALQQLDTCLSLAKFKPHRSRFFSQKIELLLAINKEAEASDLIIATWKSDPVLAGSVFGRMQMHYQGTGNPALVIAWCQRLLDLGKILPLESRHQVLTWKLAAAITAGGLPAIKEAVDQLMDQAEPLVASPLLQQQIETLIQSGKQPLAADMIAHVAAKKNLSVPYQILISTMNLKLAIVKNDWTRTGAAFVACVEQLPDDALLALMQQTFSDLARYNQTPLIDQLCKQVIMIATTKTQSVQSAARRWVEMGVKESKALLPERLEFLLKNKLQVEQVGLLFDRYFYDMVDTPAIIRKLCPVGEKMVSACKDPMILQAIKIKLLDAAFLIENYDLAVEMLEKGIPGKDESWHRMMLPKVKAHRALTQNKPLEAISYFREFMNAWRTDDEEEYDPTSGIAYSREWLMGRNAMRIAGIYEKIPDLENAKKAKEEAKNYFRIALKKAQADPKAMDLLKTEVKGLGL